MTTTESDIVARIDEAVVDTCHGPGCDRTLRDSPSEWFCCQSCQQAWTVQHNEIAELTGYREPWDSWADPGERVAYSPEVEPLWPTGPFQWTSGPPVRRSAAPNGGRFITLDDSGATELPVTRAARVESVFHRLNGADLDDFIRIVTLVEELPTGQRTTTIEAPSTAYTLAADGNIDRIDLGHPDVRVTALGYRENPDQVAAAIEWLEAGRSGTVTVTPDLSVFHRGLAELGEAVRRFGESIGLPRSPSRQGQTRAREVEEALRAGALEARRNRNTGPQVHADPRRNRGRGRR